MYLYTYHQYGCIIASIQSSMTQPNILSLSMHTYECAVVVSLMQCTVCRLHRLAGVQPLLLAVHQSSSCKAVQQGKGKILMTTSDLWQIVVLAKHIRQSKSEGNYRKFTML
ncbi:TPA: hypothetical protein ACH3X2_003005 [Trebouxia sp. C0005]